MPRLALAAAALVALLLLAAGARRAGGAGAACASTLDCASPLVCSAGVCAPPPCGGGCPVGSLCVGGACVSEAAVFAAAVPAACGALDAFVAQVAVAAAAADDGAAAVAAAVNFGASKAYVAAGIAAISGVTAPVALATSADSLSANLSLWMTSQDSSSAFEMADNAWNLAAKLRAYASDPPPADHAFAPAASVAVGVAASPLGGGGPLASQILNYHLSDLRFAYGAGAAPGALAATALAAAAALETAAAPFGPF